jgi:hypothetical protein
MAWVGDWFLHYSLAGPIKGLSRKPINFDPMIEKKQIIHQMVE